MKYPGLSHQELPQSHNYHITEFFLSERSDPVALLRYKVISNQIIVDTFCTVNGNYRGDIDTFWIKDEIARMGKFDFGKNLYPGIGEECLRLFIDGVTNNHASLVFQSAPSAVGYYRKVANRLLESGDISSWKQGNGGELMKKIPLPFIKWLYLDYLCKYFSNPTHFTFQFYN